MNRNTHLWGSGPADPLTGRSLWLWLLGGQLLQNTDRHKVMMSGEGKIKLKRQTNRSRSRLVFPVLRMINNAMQVE